VKGLLGPHPAILFLGFLFVGSGAAAFFALSTRPAMDPARRRLYGALSFGTLFVGGPLWLILAALLGLL
jgi:hypothetical protein